MKKYSVLTINFNNYELLREPKELDPDCEYIYVTDDENLKSDKWKIIVDHDLDNLTPFLKCLKVRYNLFKYATTDVCIFMDGSIQINKSLKKLYEDFMNSGADLGLNVHPERNNVYDEYSTWMYYRHYPKLQYNNCMKFFEVTGYDPKTKGLYQATMRICKNTELNREIDDSVYSTLIYLSKNTKKLERLDQTIYSFIINRFFKDEIKIFAFSQQVFQSKYLTWYIHKTKEKIKYNKGNNRKLGYFQGKKVRLYKLK